LNLKDYRAAGVFAAFPARSVGSYILANVSPDAARIAPDIYGTIKVEAVIGAANAWPRA
jgi:hypothetical protein